MKNYAYQAVNSQGQEISGLISATDEREALRQLQQQNLIPLLLQNQDEKSVVAGSQKKTNQRDKLLAIQELTTLLNAGVPLAESIESIASAHYGTHLAAEFNKVLKGLRNGERFSNTLENTELALPNYLIHLVAAGELTGKLGQALQTGLEQMEYDDRTKQEMKNALTYPAILIVSGIAAIMLVFIVVVPKFANLVKGDSSNIPLLSQWVIGFGMFVNANLPLFGAVLLIFGMLVASAQQNTQIKNALYQSLVRIPLLGQWILQTEIGRWASMLSALLASRVPLISAMELAQKGVKITTMSNRLQQVQNAVKGGARIADALATNQALDATGINLVRVGERSGELATMLRALAVLYENSSRDRMKRFLLLLEPIAILLIGTFIGIIMVAIMLAVTSMNETLI